MAGNNEFVYPFTYVIFGAWALTMMFWIRQMYCVYVYPSSLLRAIMVIMVITVNLHFIHFKAYVI